MVERRNVEFEAEGGVKLRGWLFMPSSGPRFYPAITMAYGYAGIKEQGIEPFTKTFAEGGFVVLFHDHSLLPCSYWPVRRICAVILKPCSWGQSTTSKSRWLLPVDINS